MRYIKACVVSNFRTGFDSQMVYGITPFVFLYSLGEQHPNVFSFGDLAILCGMGMLCHHRKINRGMFEKYHRRLSPYCSVASLYFQAVAGGVIPEMKDYTPKRSGKKVKIRLWAVPTFHRTAKCFSVNPFQPSPNISFKISAKLMSLFF